MRPFPLGSGKVIAALQTFDGTDAAWFGRVSVGCFLRCRYLSPLQPPAISTGRVGHPKG